MITKFKIYESVSTQPKIGDYVLIDIEKYSHARRTIKDVISTIAKITNIKKEHGGDNIYYILKFDLIENNPEFKYYFSENGEKSYYISDFKYWSEDKEDLMTIISSEKYNL